MSPSVHAILLERTKPEEKNRSKRVAMPINDQPRSFNLSLKIIPSSFYPGKLILFFLTGRKKIQKYLSLHQKLIKQNRSTTRHFLSFEQCMSKRVIFAVDMSCNYMQPVIHPEYRTDASKLMSKFNHNNIPSLC